MNNMQEINADVVVIAKANPQFSRKQIKRRLIRKKHEHYTFRGIPNRVVGGKLGLRKRANLFAAKMED